MPAGFAGLRPGALAATLLVWPALVSSGPTLDPRRAEVTFGVREFQPQVPYAGRMNGIAVHPADDNIVIVASDTGGLFRSRDRGATFEHVNSFPAWSVWDVTFHPDDPSVVLATTARDFRGAGAGGGIWRSANGGLTWSKPATANPPAVGACQAGAAAYKIAVEPGSGTVFVTTECGIARSSDRGATWTHQWFSGPAPFQPRYWAVTALGGGRAVAAGPGGIAQSVDRGVNWWPIASGVGAVTSYQALAGSPYYRDDVYVINSALELWASTDAGRTWGRLPTGSVEGRGACGGFEFVRVVPRDRRSSSWPFLEEPGLDLYLGNQCFLFRSHARRPFWSFFRPVYSGGWSRLGIDHDDTRDLAFFRNGRPAFLSTDGGLHRTGDDGATWPLTASGAGGLNALQLYEVTGQQIESPRRHDLYIGTQDNNLWSSADTGRTWPFQQFWEGAGIFLEPRVAREELSHVTYGTCGPCVTLQSGANFRDPIDWPDAQPGFGSPVLVGPGAHVQPTGPLDSDRTRSFGLSLTNDLGVRWSEAVASFGVATAQLPKVSRYGTTPVLYQAYRQGTDPAGNATFWLARVSGVLESSGPVRPVFPRMTGFGSIGVHPTMFVWSQVFGVDPWDPMHLIAADAGSGAMMRSTDGGESWSRLDALTNLVTKGGALQFTLDLGDLPFSLGSAVGFSPQDPNMVLVGAFEGGLYFSFDRGETWQLVPNSERIPRVTAFHWQTQSTVFVSSYGRGLWRLSISLRYPTDLFGVGCGKCTAFDLQGLPTQGFDRALVAFGGRLSDATARAGQLVSMAVTPGTATLLFSDAKGDTFEPPEEKADQGAFDGLEVAAKLAAQGLVVRGVTFSQGKLSGVVASEKEEELGEPGPFLEFKDEGDPTPGNEGKPYVEVVTAETVSGIPVALPSGVVDVVGRGFKAVGLRPVELQVDGRAVPGKRIQVRKDGSFRARVRLRALGLRPGIHSIAALQRHGKTIVLRDASPFGVRHDDNFGERPDEDQGSDKP